MWSISGAGHNIATRSANLTLTSLGSSNYTLSLFHRITGSSSPPAGRCSNLIKLSTSVVRAQAPQQMPSRETLWWVTWRRMPDRSLDSPVTRSHRSCLMHANRLFICTNRDTASDVVQVPLRLMVLKAILTIDRAISKENLLFYFIFHFILLPPLYHLFFA